MTMSAPITPNIHTRLVVAAKMHGLTHASYVLGQLRHDIDRLKCNSDNRLIRHSLIRKITAQRYRELRSIWDMLTN